MLGLLPAAGADGVSPAAGRRTGPRRGRVALMTGCVQQVLRPAIVSATTRVLTAQGVEVVVLRTRAVAAPWPPTAATAPAECGWSSSHRRPSRRMDAMVVTAAGCGSWMKDHAQVGSAGTGRRGVSSIGSGWWEPLRLARSADGRVPGRLSPGACPAGDRGAAAAAAAGGRPHGGPTGRRRCCCGSAGLYNIEQPELARRARAAQSQAVVASGAALAITGNIGCMTQLDTPLVAAGHDVPVCHTMELLAQGPGQRLLAWRPADARAASTTAATASMSTSRRPDRSRLAATRAAGGRPWGGLAAALDAPMDVRRFVSRPRQPPRGHLGVRHHPRPAAGADARGVVRGHAGGRAPRNVTILVATGTHRANTAAELERMLGAGDRRRYRVVNHDARDDCALAYAGRTSTGAGLVERQWLDADVRITTGFVEPHFFAGFSGGPKMVAPGLAGLATTLGCTTRRGSAIRMPPGA